MLLSAPDFQPENLPAALVESLSLDTTPKVEPENFSGGQCRVYKAVLRDSRVCAVRVPQFERGEDGGDIIDVLRGEMKMIRYLNSKGFAWVPQYFGASLTFANPAGLPYIVLTWINGCTHQWTDSIIRPVRDKVLAQLALIQTELINCTLEYRGTADDFFARIMNNRQKNVRNGKIDNIGEVDCEKQQSLACRALNPDLDQAPYAVDHGDLKLSNLVMDKDWNIVGVIDLGMAQMVPMQLAAGFPRLLHLTSPTQPISYLLESDRESYMSSLKALEPKYPQVINWVLRVQGDENVDFNSFVLESIMSKGMHASMARLGWKPTHCRIPSL